MFKRFLPFRCLPALSEAAAVQLSNSSLHQNPFRSPMFQSSLFKFRCMPALSEAAALHRPLSSSTSNRNPYRSPMFQLTDTIKRFVIFRCMPALSDAASLHRQISHSTSNLNPYRSYSSILFQESTNALMRPRCAFTVLHPWSWKDVSLKTRFKHTGKGKKKDTAKGKKKQVRFCCPYSNCNDTFADPPAFKKHMMNKHSVTEMEALKMINLSKSLGVYLWEICTNSLPLMECVSEIYDWGQTNKLTKKKNPSKQLIKKTRDQLVARDQWLARLVKLTGQKNSREIWKALGY